MLAATAVPDLGRLLRLRAVRARRRAARAARSTSTPRSTSYRPRDWAAAEAERPQPGAVPDPAQRDPPRAPGAAAAAQPDPPPRRRRVGPRLQQAGVHRPRRRHGASWWSTSTRTGPARPPSTSTCRPSGWTGTTSFAVHDVLTGADLAVGAAQLRAARPVRRARARPRRAPDRRREPRPRDRRSPTPSTSATRATPTGSSGRSSTRCWSGRSSTRTATASATCAGSPRSWTTCSGSASTACGCRRSSRSPLRDGGYDVADYTDVLPELGHARATSSQFVDEAHERGMRVIIDFVMNHTWTSTRGSRPAAPTRTARTATSTCGPTPTTGYPDARIIFVDTETSNWTFDPVRQQYFWHRFFSHQPDLNFENPRVQEAILEALRFWLDLGIDGFRLDAVPVPVRGGGHATARTSRETHEFLRRVRAEVDRLYPDRVLLAEANQWPADVVDYFGDPEVGGDECHMAFHFPVMPRLFMAVRRESRYPISEILAADPADPQRLPVGHLPAQPRRADPRDGHRRGARLHVGRVRQGPADEGQHRHPPPAGPAARQRPRPDRAVHRAAAVAARLPGPVLRRRDRDGRQHLAG